MLPMWYVSLHIKAHKLKMSKMIESCNLDNFLKTEICIIYYANIYVIVWYLIILDVTVSAEISMLLQLQILTHFQTLKSCNFYTIAFSNVEIQRNYPNTRKFIVSGVSSFIIINPKMSKLH